MVWKKILCRAFLLFIGDKKIALPVFSCFHYWTLLLCLVTVQKQGKDTQKVAVDMSKRGESFGRRSAWE